MVEIKKKVIESSSSEKPFRPFRINQPPNPHPPNIISNVETDDEDEKEATFSVEEYQDEQVAELNGVWDFLLPIPDSENEHEALPVSTRSKGSIDPIQPNKNWNLQLLLLKIKLLLKISLPLLPK